MGYIIDGYKPEKMFNYFEDISRIPRGSGNEDGIAGCIEKFASERGLFCIRDRFNNVYVRKPASKGYENKPAIMLQGHTDMVCEQNSGNCHDFENEGLELYIENGNLSARGTTLGGDDGVAVAAMLTALDDSELEHPELECLFTTSEETGMTGAENFDYSVVKAKKLINLDSEEEGVATVSCAGGVNISFILKPDRLPIAAIGRPVSIKITGLAGGHSGEDIVRERGNADVIMLRLLSELYEIHPFNLVTINGGNRGNAIPRECEAVILTSEPAEATDFMVKYCTEVIAKLLPDEDKNFKVRIDKAKGKFDKMLSFADTSKLFSLSAFMPNGVISRIPTDISMVETSNNLGIIKDNCDDGITVLYHGRSSVNSKIDILEHNARRVSKVLGIELEISGRYSGWPMKADSQLVADFEDIANKILGKGNARISAIHAGLECGIICGKIDGLDAISIGPDIYDIHTPSESLDLASFERMWKILKELLKK